MNWNPCETALIQPPVESTMCNLMISSLCGLAVRRKVGTLAARITGSQNELYACTPPLQPPHPLCFTPPVFLIHCQRGGCHVTDDCPIQMQISVLSVGSKFKWHPSNYLVTQLTRM